jgi:hypothetical protein
MQGQGPKSDISSVVAAGKVDNHVYSNAYFGISLTAPKAKFTAPSLVNIAGGRARLVNIVYNSPQGAMNYTLGLMAESLENFPKGMPTALYVRSVRHQLGGMVYRHTERSFRSQSRASPLLERFSSCKRNRTFGYDRGIYSTFLDGYVVSLETASAVIVVRSQNQLKREALNSLRRLECHYFLTTRSMVHF